MPMDASDVTCTRCSEPTLPGREARVAGPPVHLWCRARDAYRDAIEEHERASHLCGQAGNLVAQVRALKAETGDRRQPSSPALVLVVEDEPDMRENLVRILRRGPYACVTAADGREAVALLTRQPPPDLILTDVRLPGLDGLELLRQARSIVPGVPVVLVTACADARAEDAVREGAATMLMKPFTAPGLLHVVQAALERGGTTPRP
jgi:CheY-like chemotaxis protein